jgi:hypothetical protein
VAYVELLKNSQADTDISNNIVQGLVDRRIIDFGGDGTISVNPEIGEQQPFQFEPSEYLAFLFIKLLAF